MGAPKHHPHQIWRFGLEHLRHLRKPYGFAASEAKTGLYAALFGRDSLWIAIFLLNAARLVKSDAFRTWVEQATVDVLSALAARQGNVERDAIEEQPGKIIHEYRETIDARLQRKGLNFDGGRSFSGFDQTFLFVIAYHQFADEFPENPRLNELWPAVEGALTWINNWGDDDGDGLYEYRRRDARNILHQVWRDSFDSIVETGITAPPHPIAWLSVQAYAFRALSDAAELRKRRGDYAQAATLARRAEALRDRVNESFWLADDDCFAIALDGTKSPVRMVSSDAGHALWSGVVAHGLEAKLIRRLMRPDMMTEYGLRTLSSASEFYAPFAYHRGNIWPFDNSVFLLGLLASGYHDEARRVMETVGSAVLRLGSPVEVYVALDSALLVEPQMNTRSLLLRHRPVCENLNQGFSAAAVVLIAAVWAKLEGVEVDYALG